MAKPEYIEFFIDAIKKSDEAIYGEIEVDSEEIDKSEDYFYFEFNYQIDDRIERMDKDVIASMKKILGEDYGVSINRLDAFPNGYASYSIKIDR